MTTDPTMNMLPLLYGADMTPEQQDQMRRTMMAQALMGGTQASTQPQSSFAGGLNQGLSPILHAAMINRLMSRQIPQGGSPARAYNTAPSTASAMQRELANQPGGGGYYPNSGFSIAPAQGGVAGGPGLLSRLGTWVSNQFSGGTAGSSGSNSGW